MRRTKKLNSRIIILILLASIACGILGNILFSCIDRLIYPERYYEEVMKYSSEYAVPPHLVFAVIKTESNFDPRALSSAGAMGLMQILPSTYSWMASVLGEVAVTEMLYDPELNIKYGTYYLSYLHARFGSWEKAIIAYNWGEGNFSSFMESDPYVEGDYGSIPVKETRNYIKKVTKYWEKYNDLY